MRVYVVFRGLKWAVHSRVDALPALLLRHNPVGSVVRGFGCIRE